MPSVFSHAVFSSSLGAAYARGPMPRRFWALAAVCSVVPDLDVVAFAPFSAERFFAPWRPIEVSPIGVWFFSARGMAVLASEIVWVWVPAGVLVLSTNLTNLSNRRSP